MILQAEGARWTTGRPGHDGLFRIQGEPVAGTPATLEASLPGGATTSNEFYLVSERRQTILKLEMREVSADQGFLEFTGPVELPSVPFRVAVMGRDSNGRTYQRFFSNLFHAESVEISQEMHFDELAAGSTRQVTFTVRNIGFPRNFSIMVTDAHQFVSKVEPKEFGAGSGRVWDRARGFDPAGRNCARRRRQSCGRCAKHFRATNIELHYCALFCFLLRRHSRSSLKRPVVGQRPGPIRAGLFIFPPSLSNRWPAWRRSHHRPILPGTEGS